MIVALSGGVGGAKLSSGLYRQLPAGRLTVIGNTADDLEIHGLHISPDLDTAVYTLAGMSNPETGWGIAGDTFAALDQLRRYGVDTWFKLGDRDLATHLLRTQWLREGSTLTAATERLARALGVTARVLPMCDDPVRTFVQVADGWIDFQEYFVHRGYRDDVSAVDFRGAASTRATDPALEAIAAAGAIVLCPSNPIVSIGPILAVPGVREALRASGAPKVAISPIVGGAAVSGPAGRLMAGLGYEVSSVGVAQVYREFLTGLVIDRADAELADRLCSLGIEVLVTDTIMGERSDRDRLAAEVLAFARQLASGAPEGTG